MNRAYYSDSITGFLAASDQAILGFLAEAGSHALEPTQRDAWVEQIRVLKEVLSPYRRRGKVYFEYSIPRLGRRIDVLAVVGHVLFILEFKAGEKHFAGHARDQVWDYALDLQNFHETSHNLAIAPILIATRADDLIAFAAATAPPSTPRRASAANLAENSQAIEAIIADACRQSLEAARLREGHSGAFPNFGVNVAAPAGPRGAGGHLYDDESRPEHAIRRSFASPPWAAADGACNQPLNTTHYCSSACAM